MGATTPRSSVGLNHHKVPCRQCLHISVHSFPSFLSGRAVTLCVKNVSAREHMAACSNTYIVLTTPVSLLLFAAVFPGLKAPSTFCGTQNCNSIVSERHVRTNGGWSVVKPISKHHSPWHQGTLSRLGRRSHRVLILLFSSAGTFIFHHAPALRLPSKLRPASVHLLAGTDFLQLSCDSATSSSDCRASSTAPHSNRGRGSHKTWPQRRWATLTTRAKAGAVLDARCHYLAAQATIVTR